MKVKRSMLEYCKIVLAKISFNKFLFKKEYRKSLRMLPEEEVGDFKKWARKNFSSKYKRAA